MPEMSDKLYNWFNKKGKKKVTCPICGKHPNPYKQHDGQNYCPECIVDGEILEYPKEMY